MGSIKARTTQVINNLPTGKLVLSIPLTPTHPLGNFCGHIIYPIGTRDTFTVRIFNRGVVTAISVLSGGAAVRQVPALTPVQLRFDGVRIGNAASTNILPLPYTVDGIVTRTETRFAANVRFNRCGPVRLYPGLVFDGAAPRAVIMEDASKRYQGGMLVDIQVVAAPSGCPSTGTARRSAPAVAGRATASAPIVDVAPGPMSDVFRRLSNFAPTTIGGATYVAIDSVRWCPGMGGDQVRTIIIPLPSWSVTNVGTAVVGTGFTATLGAGGRVLQSQNIPVPLAPGQTRAFTVARDRSRVAVRTFTDRPGCYISPTAQEYFEDPAFEVTVGAVAGEAPAQQANNARSF